MTGGVNAWEGLRAEGAPESGMTYFPDSATPGELLDLAWHLEDGSRRFYAEVAEVIKDEEAAGLLASLATAEEHHKDSLDGLRNELFSSVEKDAADGTGSFSEAGIMEGGIKVSDAIKWASDKDVKTILEFTISAEANAYDLYIKLGRKFDDERSKNIFTVLSKEEMSHLERMGALLEKKV